jgi:plasmid stabilization system protein ParE
VAGRRRRVVWSDEALRALDEAASYIANESPGAARSRLERALAAAAGLTKLPERGRIVPERDDPAVREVFVGRYRLIDEVASSRVVVLAFVHGARRLVLRGSDR